MILQRLATSIRKQDWFTVAIETLIVVFGVFIGLQVSNWNEARNERIEERDIFKRLILEGAAEEAELVRHRAYHVNNLGEIAELVARLEDPERCGDYSSESSKRVLLSIGDFPEPRLAFSTARELVSTGRIALVSSDEVRIGLQATLVQAEWIERAWQRYLPLKQAAEDVYMAAGPAYTNPIEWTLDYDLPYEDFLKSVELRTPDKLCNRPDLVALASNAATSQAFYVAKINVLARKLSAYRAELSATAEERFGSEFVGEAP
ncbi:hypothetical protein WNY37_16865 [Henriciella sp. AS95]|uniref:hypothetical protein n=1 Tax=Henriciella sp. AS95 TaxID=3135782 RepID=UPI003177318A